MEAPISDFGNILLFIIAGTVFACGGLTTAYLVRPRRPNAEKNTTYESGEDPVGSSWRHFNIRFYVVALIFILFEVEIVFLFPWATVFGDTEIIAGAREWIVYALVEAGIFIFVLFLGLAYCWHHDYLQWIKPKKKNYTKLGSVPNEIYTNYKSNS